MNFLADENFPNASCSLLEASGYVVRKVSLLFTGKPDKEILSIAYKENEIILTFDKDFGELIFKQNLPVPAGLVLYRLKEFINEYALVLDGFFTVVSPEKIRQRKLNP